jgi:hypothetical protein
MEVVDPYELIKGFRRVDLLTATAIDLRGVLDDVRGLRARLDGIEVEVARRLSETSGTAERDVARSAQRANRHGAKVMARAAAIQNVPSLGDALSSGELGGDHVDAFAKVLGSLDGPTKEGLTEAASAIVASAAASGSTPDEFAATLNAAAQKIAADGGMSRFERQRRATRLRTWTDRATGMFRLSGAFDPETGAVLHGRLEAAMAAMFAKKTPSTAPSDPGEKQDHLRALALLALTSGRSTSKPRTEAASSQETGEWDDYTDTLLAETARFGRPEAVIVIDTTNLDNNGKPTVDWGIPVTIPWNRVQSFIRRAKLRPVVIHNGAVIDADGELNLGRTTRLASRAQRRALRAIYATCAVDGCNVSFTHTKPHHVHWWRHGGPTDIANLLPLCSKHHHCAHEGGWILTLGTNRELTIELPDGQIMRTGPPARKAAA